MSYRFKEKGETWWEVILLWTKLSSVVLRWTCLADKGEESRRTPVPMAFCSQGECAWRLWIIPACLHVQQNFWRQPACLDFAGETCTLLPLSKQTQHCGFWVSKKPLLRELCDMHAGIHIDYPQHILRRGSACAHFITILGRTASQVSVWTCLRVCARKFSRLPCPVKCMGLWRPILSCSTDMLCTTSNRLGKGLPSWVWLVRDYLCLG